MDVINSGGTSYVGWVFQVRQTSEIGQCESDNMNTPVVARMLTLRMKDKSHQKFRLIDLTFFDGDQDYLGKKGHVTN